MIQALGDVWMEDLFCRLEGAFNAGMSSVIVSIIESTGSAPRRAGAKMLVTCGGHVCGTVGGGTIEYEATRLAQSFLKDKMSGIHSFRLTQNQIEDLGMVCGGNVTLYFGYISGDDNAAALVAEDARKKIKSGEESWLITDMSTGNMAVYGKKSGFFGLDNPPAGMLDAMTSRPAKQSLNGREYFVEPLVPAGIVYVFGGGHVSQELVPAASRVGFRCVVLDDRPEFTSRELFPDALDCVPINFESIAKKIDVTKRDYIVIMTRGHRYDSAVQAYAMRTDARYIGVIGSRSKIAHVSAQMRGLGFTDEDLARVKTPIGLDIKAETPAEIAVSIVAELIMVRAVRNTQRKVGYE